MSVLLPLAMEGSGACLYYSSSSSHIRIMWLSSSFQTISFDIWVIVLFLEENTQTRLVKQQWFEFKQGM